MFLHSEKIFWGGGRVKKRGIQYGVVHLEAVHLVSYAKKRLFRPSIPTLLRFLYGSFYFCLTCLLRFYLGPSSPLKSERTK